MKKIGIICEYNPLHNGHIYHINKIKEMFPNSLIILVMSGYFTQRGDVSIINKWDKAYLALEHNIDLVVELPFSYTLQSADYFAEGAVKILNYLNVDYLIFGSESNDIDYLNKLADISVNDNYDILIKKYLKEGLNYKNALSNSIKDINGKSINDPNDILGLCYIKAIRKLKSNIIPLTIKRTNNYNSNILENNISSASSIRYALNNNINIDKQVPNKVTNYINNISNDNYFNILKYKILSENDLSIYNTVDEGIGFRIKKCIVNSTSFDDLVNNIKTKRYSYNKIKRMLICILCNYSKEDNIKYRNIKYIRVLGFNNNGRLYLNNIKKNINIPIITKFNNNLDLELKIASIYSSIFEENIKNKIIINEYSNKPIIKNN